MEREHMKVGFVGLGKMGVGIATRILFGRFQPGRVELLARALQAVGRCGR